MTDQDRRETLDVPGTPEGLRAKPLPRRLPVATDAPELVPARMINEVLYCERLMYLEWAQGEFADNAFTVDGRAVHQRADTPGGALPPRRGQPDDGDDSDEDGDDEPAPYQARA